MGPSIFTLPQSAERRVHIRPGRGHNGHASRSSELDGPYRADHSAKQRQRVDEEAFGITVAHTTTCRPGRSLRTALRGLLAHDSRYGLLGRCGPARLPLRLPVVLTLAQ